MSSEASNSGKKRKADQDAGKRKSKKAKTEKKSAKAGIDSVPKCKVCGDTYYEISDEVVKTCVGCKIECCTGCETFEHCTGCDADFCLGCTAFDPKTDLCMPCSAEKKKKRGAAAPADKKKVVAQKTKAAAPASDSDDSHSDDDYERCASCAEKFPSNELNYCDGGCDSGYCTVCAEFYSVCLDCADRGAGRTRSPLDPPAGAGAGSGSAKPEVKRLSKEEKKARGGKGGLQSPPGDGGPQDIVDTDKCDDCGKTFAEGELRATIGVVSGKTETKLAINWAKTLCIACESKPGSRLKCASCNRTEYKVAMSITCKDCKKLVCNSCTTCKECGSVGCERCLACCHLVAIKELVDEYESDERYKPLPSSIPLDAKITATIRNDERPEDERMMVAQDWPAILHRNLPETAALQPEMVRKMVATAFGHAFKLMDEAMKVHDEGLHDYLTETDDPVKSFRSMFKEMMANTKQDPILALLEGTPSP